MSDYPYAGRFPVHRTLPEHGRPREEVLAQLETMAREEDAFWETGKCSGTMYCGDHDHYDFLNRGVRPLLPRQRAAARHVPERDQLRGRDRRHGPGPLSRGAVTGSTPGGLVTTGGTGSILHAVLAYREHAAQRRGGSRPNIIKPETAHPAFDKACHLFGVECRVAPVDPSSTQVDVDWVADHVDEQTVALIGSACNYGYGTIDPIDELSVELAARRGIGLHVDACLGGFILPFGEELGYDIPAFDFRVPGVTSISADTHKYGYALKGTSTLLFRDKDVRDGSTSSRRIGAAASTARPASRDRGRVACWPPPGRR